MDSSEELLRGCSAARCLSVSNGWRRVRRSEKFAYTALRRDFWPRRTVASRSFRLAWCRRTPIAGKLAQTRHVKAARHTGVHAVSVVTTQLSVVLSLVESPTAGVQIAELSHRDERRHPTEVQWSMKR